MLEIKNITARIKSNEKKVLDEFSLTINKGEIHAIMGPNGVGKSTLSKVIMGHPDYEITDGTIKFNDENIQTLTTDEIARKGIFLLMQDPAVIEGVSNSECIRTAMNTRRDDPINLYEFIKTMNKELDKLSMPKEMMHRSINAGFSGGEKKKNEVLQLTMLEPSLIILDELDSGLDVDSLKIVCQNIVDYLEEHKEASILIITHYSRILDLIKPDYVHQMMNGNIIRTGDIKLAKEIEKTGYHGINEVSEKVSNE